MEITVCVCVGVYVCVMRGAKEDILWMTFNTMEVFVGIIVKVN